MPEENCDDDLLNVDEEHASKNHRGPTLLYNVHARKLENHVPIFLNEHGQPVEPTDKFLGTIAHEHLWEPLIYINWHKVPNRDKMWEFVTKWVLESIACTWRLFKCRLKSNHYYKYDNDVERWRHRPSRVPDSHFKLSQYWKTSIAKFLMLSLRN
ncbi:hypothetical protein Cgig2_001121 [Carnegiea gigantea]|uniref:Transposase n=1 Tax=Carnegiea gigantea TaxID=171969 RepID=A0A9Q1GL03_9CARY|nr:hypothetical protein Cgig2_001121 [Carnegiea gigantea]